ncbi:hypothetical protein FC78_GL001845 [Companilactobacillus bobalius DSM 19674]|nr:hypothetical protein FC78_GL001845 [Companilactobacillus bobalius DSM 19674]
MFDRNLLLKAAGTVGTLFGVVGTAVGFFDFSVKTRYHIFILFFIICFLFYILEWLSANRISDLVLKYDESTIEIKSGDIFSGKYINDDTIRIFAFNEYFDTKVDNEIISKSSLNGQVIIKEVSDIDELDRRVSDDKHLKKNEVGTNRDRSNGKKKKYKLGTIFKYNDNTMFTAMTHFDDENKANLTIQEYIRFLINFWDEVNTIYAGKTVVITLLGSGITRLDNNTYTSNQILEIILWTFYLRRIKFKKPAQLIILMDDNTNKGINYYKIRGMFNGLQK